MVLGKVDVHMQMSEIGSISPPVTKINSKWIKDLNVRHDNYEKETGEMLQDIEPGKNFLA
jgi:hypothetical protein